VRDAVRITTQRVGHRPVRAQAGQRAPASAC
jgi:hypothetical protein